MKLEKLTPSRVAHKAQRAVAKRTKETAYFIHIGKTGGSALKAALRPVDASGRYLIMLRSGNRLADLPEGAPFFFTTRDPAKRYVSAFYSRQRQGRPLNDRPWKGGEEAAFTRFPTANALAEALGEGDPAAEEAMHAIQHLRDPQHTWLSGQLEQRRGDLIIAMRQENLADDFRVLCERLDVRAELPSDPVLAHRNPDGVDRSLSPEGLRAIEAWYAEDYAFLRSLHGETSAQ